MKHRQPRLDLVSQLLALPLVEATTTTYRFRTSNTLRLVDATAGGVEAAQGWAVDSDHLRLDDLG